MKEAAALKIAVIVSALLVASPAFAGKNAPKRGTPEQAKAMVARAIALFNKEGRKAAFDRFNKRPGPEFKHLDLYIFVLRARDATIVAHAQNPMFVGLNGLKLLDARGISMGRLILGRVTTKGSWADYFWKDSHTGEILPKSSWIVLHKGHIFGCGQSPSRWFDCGCV